jgi:hypothetical protein
LNVNKNFARPKIFPRDAKVIETLKVEGNVNDDNTIELETKKVNTTIETKVQEETKSNKGTESYKEGRVRWRPKPPVNNINGSTTTSKSSNNFVHVNFFNLLFFVAIIFHFT